MRQFAISLVTLFLVVSPVQASERTTRFGPPSGPIRFEPLSGQPGQLGRLINQVRAHQQAARKGVEGSAIVAEASGQTILIAAAANTPGAFDSFFTSDLTFVNLGDEPQDIAIFYLARGVDSRNATGARTTIDGPPVTVQNILAQLGVSGVGSLLIVPISNGSQPEFDPDSSIDAYSRLLTPGDEGELSQSFPAVYPDFLEFEIDALALGHRQDANFRVNAGVVNLEETAQSFLVTIFHETNFVEFVIDVPPFSMNQVPIPAGNFGALSILFEPQSAQAFEWIGYAASNDNRSGDSWSSFAARIADPDDFAKRP